MRSWLVIEAARESLAWRERMLRQRKTHLIETTLTGAGVLRHMERAQALRYWVKRCTTYLWTHPTKQFPALSNAIWREGICSGGGCKAPVPALHQNLACRN